MSDDPAERPNPDESPDAAAPEPDSDGVTSGDPDATAVAPNSPWATPPGGGPAATSWFNPEPHDTEAGSPTAPDLDAIRAAGLVDPDAEVAASKDPGAMSKDPGAGSKDPGAGPRGSSDPDATRVTGPAAADATHVLGPNDADATRPIRPVDARVRPGTPDPTAVIPATPPAWRGQSGVPRHDGSADDRTSTWNEPPPENRSWLMPVFIGVVGVLVLAAVAFGVVAALRNTSKPSPLPPVPIATQTPTPTAATTAPTSPPSTPSSPSVLPSDSSAYVIVPSTLEGIVFTYAEEELNALGLKYALQPEVTTSVPPDTVIRTNPAGGQLVVPGTTIVIVYAVVPTPSPSASPSASPSPSPSVSTSPR